MPDNSVEIEQIESILNSGEKSSTVDGTTVVNQDAKRLEQRLAFLKRTHTGPNGERHMVKPIASSIRIVGL